MSDLYDEDIVLWSERQGELLRRRAAGDFVNDAELDWPNIAEEIEAVGRAEQDQLTNRLAVLLAHMLKWRCQPERRGNSWRLAILEQRRRARRLVARNPSLRPRRDDILVEAYGDAVLIAERETELPGETFPPVCPWSFDEVMQPDFLGEEPQITPPIRRPDTVLSLAREGAERQAGAAVTVLPSLTNALACLPPNLAGRRIAGIAALRPATPLLHASEAATQPNGRRVLQVDYSVDALPGGLQWSGV